MDKKEDNVWIDEVKRTTGQPGDAAVAAEAVPAIQNVQAADTASGIPGQNQHTCLLVQLIFHVASLGNLHNGYKICRKYPLFTDIMPNIHLLPSSPPPVPGLYSISGITVISCQYIIYTKRYPPHP